MRTKRTSAIAVAALALAAVVLPVQAAVGTPAFSVSATISTDATMATLPNLDADTATGERNWDGTTAEVAWDAPELPSGASADYKITRTINGASETIDPELTEIYSGAGIKFTEDLTTHDTPCPTGWNEAGTGNCGLDIDSILSYQIEYTVSGWAPESSLEIQADAYSSCGGHHVPGGFSIFC